MINEINKNKLKKLNLLYIEDEDNTRKNFSDVFSLLFKDVLLAKDAKEGLSLYKKGKVDIILSDINMPGMNGIELVKKIRIENNKIPCILLSGDTNTELLLEASSLKLINYLVKPVSLDNLTNEFEKALDELETKLEPIVYFKNGIKFDRVNRLIYDEGKTTKITKNEFKFLNLLSSNQKEVTTTDSIKATIWGKGVKVNETALKSLINKLRIKVGKSSIVNVSGNGFYLD